MPKYFGKNDYDSNQEAIADGLFAIADAIKKLNNKELGVVIKDGLADLADSVEGIKRILGRQG